MRGSENPSSKRPDAGQVNRWGSVAAADGAAEASGPGTVAAAPPAGAAAVGGDVVTDDVEGAAEVELAGAPPATGGRVEVAAGASARWAAPLASERTTDGTVSPAGSSAPAGRTGSSGVTLTGEACAAGAREAAPGWPDAGEAAPGTPARLADAAGADAEGAGRAGGVEAGRGAFAEAVPAEPDPDGGTDDRFSTGAGRGAVQPASSAASANAASWAMPGSGFERNCPAVRVFKSVV